MRNRARRRTREWARRDFRRGAYVAGGASALVLGIGCSTMLGIETDSVYTPAANDSGAVADDSAATVKHDDAGSDVQVTHACKGTLRVRINKDLKGATADVGTPFFFGMYDYLRRLRDKGGLRGCDIEIRDFETQYVASESIRGYNEWKADPTWPEVSTIFTHGTGPTFAIAYMAEADKKLVISGSYAGLFTSPVPMTRDVTFADINVNFQASTMTETKKSVGYGHNFFPSTDYSTGARIGMHAAWRLGAKRIALFYDKDCLYCRDPTVAAKTYVAKIGSLTLGRDLATIKQTSLPDQADVTRQIVAYFTQEVAHVQSERLAGRVYEPVDWVWSGNTVAPTVAILKGVDEAQREVARLAAESKANADPKDDVNAWDIKVIANNWGIGEQTYGMCGQPCVGRMYGIFPFKAYGDINADGMQDVMSLHDEYRAIDARDAGADAGLLFPGPYRDIRYVQGYVAALVWRLAVEKAVDDGNEVVTSAALKAALETFTNVNLRGLTAGPVTFTPTDHRAQANEVVYNIGAAGRFQLVDTYSIGLEPDWIGW